MHMVVIVDCVGVVFALLLMHKGGGVVGCV